MRDGLWLLPERADLIDAKGHIRGGIARDAPAGFTPDRAAAVGSGALERSSLPGIVEAVPNGH